MQINSISMSVTIIIMVILMAVRITIIITSLGKLNQPRSAKP